MSQYTAVHHSLRPAEMDAVHQVTPTGTRDSFDGIVHRLAHEVAALRRLRTAALVLIAVGLTMLPFDPTSGVGTVAAVAGSILMSIWIRRTNPSPS